MNEEQIMQMVREERNRYAKEWREKNPEKVAAANRRYWERKALARRAVENEENKRG